MGFGKSRTPNPPRLSVDYSAEDASYDQASPSSPVGHKLQTWTFPTGDSSRPPPSPSSSLHDTESERNAQKNFEHLLTQLENRHIRATAFDTFNSSEKDDGGREKGMVAVAGAVRGLASNTPNSSMDENDDTSEEDKNLDAIIANLTKINEQYVSAKSNGFNLFADRVISRPGLLGRSRPTGKLSSSFPRSRSRSRSRSRHSFQFLTEGSRSFSPTDEYGGRKPDRLARCITILESLISEDCRLQTAGYRPLLPNNGLQALVLNFAQLLLDSFWKQPDIVHQICMAVIPSFAIFSQTMHMRLLGFFNDSIIRHLLQRLAEQQNPDGNISTSIRDPGTSGQTIVPAVAIHVDSAQDETINRPTAYKPWSSQVTEPFSLQSTEAPLQDPAIYFLSGIVSPLLAAILDSVNIFAASSELELYHFYQLIDGIIAKKYDSYLDLLEIVAYHTPKARYTAIALLSTHWPAAVGHISASKAFPVSSYKVAMNLVERHPFDDDPYAHQFVPWHFAVSTKQSTPHVDCHSCAAPMSEFGLQCPFCMCTVHFGCYDYAEGCRAVEYTPKSNQKVQRVALFRFSDVLSTRRDLKPPFIRKQQHSFRLTNIFTLCICGLCQKPLWGCTAQGLRCSRCTMFVHSHCIQQTPSSDIPRCGEGVSETWFTIEWSALRQSCLEHYSDVLQIPEEEFSQRSYEEVSAIHAALWIQTEILVNGLETGSILILRNGRDISRSQDPASLQFEMHYAMRFAAEALAAGTLAISPMMQDYLAESDLKPTESFMMFDWPMLVYITSSIKASRGHDQANDFLSSSPSFLTAVSHPAEPESNHHSLEVMQLSFMRDTLASGFRLYSDFAAKHVLSHLHSLGFFHILDPMAEPMADLFEATSDPRKTRCSFPLPLGSDLSITVETLVSSVEACLCEINLSVNEFGFLLLSRRLRPNGLATDYVLRRLCKSVLSWIVAEDDTLVEILRDYMPKQAILPGVRSPNESLAWPSFQSSRPMPASSVNNGGDYIALRRTLLTRYATPWLRELHDLDPTLYASSLYAIAVELADEQITDGASVLDGTAHEADQLDKTLSYITRFSQNSVTFSAFDSLFLQWAQALSTSNVYKQPMPSLTRLVPRDSENSHRSSIIQLRPLDGALSQSSDPWSIITSMASRNSAGFSQSLHWLLTFALSGVDIPLSVWIEVSSLAEQYTASFNDCSILVQASVSSAWLRSMGRQQLQLVIGSLHKRLAPFVVDCIKKGINMSEMLVFLRRSLATCLLVYGCNRDTIKSLGLVVDEEVEGLPSRRKIGGRNETNSDPVVMDITILQALGFYIASGVDSITGILAKFVHLFLTESPFFESYEIDNFILRNGKFLGDCVWRFYEVQLPEISDIRANLLSRTLVVDQQILRDLLQTSFDVDTSWESRLDVVTRLFRIILDLLNPSFVIEDRQWQSCVIEVFHRFFTAMWLDEKEEVRMAAYTMSKSLLPGHFHAISRCWDQYLTTMPIGDRAQLVSFLIQLHSHIPHWQVLSWQVVIDNLANLELPAIGDTPRLSITKNVAPDSATIEDTLRISLLLLSLKMIASGGCTAQSTLLKVKFYLVRALGFLDVSVATAVDGSISRIDFMAVESLREAVYPCIPELCSVLDAPHALSESLNSQGASSNQRPGSVLLVGSLFVDVAIALFSSTKSFGPIPVLTLKSMVEALAIVIYKHDFLDKRLEHLQLPLRKAMQPTIELVLADGSYEVRQMALSVIQMFVRHCQTFSRHFIGQSIENVAKLISLQSHYGHNDLLVGQAKTFIETTLFTYSDRLFYTICRRSLDSEFFPVIKMVTDPNTKGKSQQLGALREILLRDTLAKAIEGERDSFQNVLNNLWSFVDIVYYQGYSVSLVQYVGQHLTHLARRAVEWPAESVDTTPLLLISAKVMQYNKTYYRELLPYVDTMLRTVLNRLTLSKRSLVELVQVSTVIFRKTQPEVAGQMQPNSVVKIIFEILGEGLRLKSRVHPVSITAMLETLTNEDSSGSTLSSTHLSSFLGLVDNGFYFLANHSWSNERVDVDFNTSVAVARMILEASTRDQNIMVRLSEHALEKSSRQTMGVRGWNIIAFAALSDPSGVWAKIIFDQLPTFSLSHHSALRTVLLSNSFPDAARTDINHAYIAIKLWVLLTKTVSRKEDVDWTAWLSVWNQVWFPFQSLITVLEDESTSDSTLLALVTWNSIADLIYFIYSLRCPLVMRTIELEGPLQRMKAAGRVQPSHKISKALRCHSELPPEVSVELLLNQMGKDIVAEEKLRAALERESGKERKTVPEKVRKDTRMPT